MSGIDIRDTQSKEVSVHADFPRWGKTKTVSLRSGKTEPTPKGSSEAEPTALGETLVALGLDETF